MVRPPIAVPSVAYSGRNPNKIIYRIGRIAASHREFLTKTTLSDCKQNLLLNAIE